MGATRDGIFFFMLTLNIMMMFFVSSGYGGVQGIKNPVCDFAAIGVVSPGCFSPTVPGTTGGSGNQPNNSTLVQQQQQAVDKLTGLTFVGGAVTGGLIGFSVGGPLGGLVGALVGGVAAGYFGYSFFSGNPSAAQSASNYVDSLPVVGALGDFTAALGAVIKYPLVVLQFLVDFLVYSAALVSVEPAFGGVMLLIESITIVWSCIYIAMGIRGVGTVS